MNINKSVLFLTKKSYPFGLFETKLFLAMSFPNQLQSKPNSVFYIGFLIFVVLNLITASFMGLHFDEAYYWLYSQNPALGYFDHPPMIAWMIKAGETLLPNKLGLRLMTILFSSVSILVLWQLSKKFSNNALLFWAVVYSTILIHPYTFLATPDAPLFLGTVLFFFFYSRYLSSDKLINCIALGASIALLIYSKYHGVLVVGFVTLSNIKLMGKRSFWMVAITAILFLLPHIWWQYSHHFPTLQYHLVDSHKTVYRYQITLKYIYSELAATGPWLGWLFLFAMLKTNYSNKFDLGLKTLGIGTFAFFLLSTSGGDFEAHWTLIAFVPLILLSIKYIEEHQKWKKWVLISGTINFTFLLIARILIITPLGDNIKALGMFKGWDKDSKEIRTLAGDTPIVFQDSWYRAARFAYYTNDKKVTNLNSGVYRRNQFDLYDTDEDLTGKTVYVLTSDSTQFDQYDIFRTSKSVWYAQKTENFRSFYNLKFKKEGEFKFKNGELLCPVSVENVYPENISLNNACFELYHRYGPKWKVIASTPLRTITIQQGESYFESASFNVSAEELKSDQIFVTFRVGKLKPIPGRIAVTLSNLD